MDIETEPWEIASDLSRNGYRVLLALQTNGGEARTSMLREQTEMSNQLVNYYLTGDENLSDGGLVERVDEADLERGRGLNIPREGYLYRLTERGRDTLSAAHEDYAFDPLEEGEIRRRFDDLEERMGQVEQRLDRISGELTQNTEEKEKAGRAIKELIEDVERLQQHIKDTQTDTSQREGDQYRSAK